MTELALKQQFLRDFARDFDIESEVVGKSMVESTSVKIDFLLRPKQHLISWGFDDGWFGVEVKHLKAYKLGKINALAWQSLSYAQSQFSLQSEVVRPLFVLMHSNLSLNLQHAARDSMPSDVAGVVSFVERGNVGWIETDAKYGWRIGFSSHGYFNFKYGRAAIASLGIKRNVGNVEC